MYRIARKRETLDYVRSLEAGLCLAKMYGEGTEILDETGRLDALMIVRKDGVLKFTWGWYKPH